MRDLLMGFTALVAGFVGGLMALVLLGEIIGRPMVRLLVIALREYRYRRADRNARELGWADHKAMTDWRKEYERRYAQLRAEARDG